MWPLWSVADHQKIVFTATRDRIFNLDQRSSEPGGLRQKRKKAEAGLTSVDRVIGTLLSLPASHLTGQPPPKSVPRKVVLTDGENGETDQKVNKYLQKRSQP